jgi:1-acyl-sn-glycerol-3-phosphate acyltransferase
LIKANHKKWALFVFDVYLKRLLKKSFSDFRLINELPQFDKTINLIITANHFSWWDGFFVYWFNKHFINKKLFVLMLEQQLLRYRFFKKLGCYSINLKNAYSTITSLRYTLDVISDSNNIVAIYPQGEIQPYEQRPIIVKDGISFLSNKTKKDFFILPIAFKIHYSNERLPCVYIRCGKLLNSHEVSSNPNLFTDEFTKNVSLLDVEFLSSSFKSFIN